MNNKFIKTLIIINGILIPTFILTLFGLLLSEYFSTGSNRHTDITDEIKTEYIFKHSSPQKIINSENYFVSKYKKEELIDDLLGNIEVVEGIGELPEHTVNIIFLNKEFEKIGNLLEKDASIKDIYIPNFFSKDENQVKLTKNITYFIAKEDTNNDQELDKYDDHFLYISNLSGQNLNTVIDKKVKEFKYINDFEQILVTYYENADNLAIGVYDIEKNLFTKKTSLNFEY